MEFEPQVAKLKDLKKQCLERLITLSSQYISSWDECIDISNQCQLIRKRKRERTNEGYSPNNHPQNSPGFHSLPQDIQFAARQQFEKHTFDNQRDQQTTTALDQQYQESRIRGKSRVEMIEELDFVITNISDIIAKLTRPDGEKAIDNVPADQTTKGTEDP